MLNVDLTLSYFIKLIFQYVASNKKICNQNNTFLVSKKVLKHNSLMVVEPKEENI